MSTQTLAQKFDALAEAGILDIDLPQAVTDNLRPSLRPYQIEALQRFLYYVCDYRQRQHGGPRAMGAARAGKGVARRTMIREFCQKESPVRSVGAADAAMVAARAEAGKGCGGCPPAFRSRL